VALLWWGVASAAQPTASDIAMCNAEAELQASTPSDSPGMASPRPAPESIQAGAAPSAPGLKVPEAAVKTDPSGSVITGTSEPLLEGMAADRADDPAFRMAYFDCMKRQTEGG